MTQLNRLAALLLLTAAGQAVVCAQECSNADFKGRYAVFTENSIIGGHVGNFAAGTLYADGMGQITEWKDTFVFVNPGTGEKTVVSRDFAATSEGPIDYEVTSDCRIVIKFVTITRPPDDRVIEIHGGLAAGGREVYATNVLPKTATAGLLFKSMEPQGSLSAKIDQIMRWLSIPMVQ